MDKAAWQIKVILYYFRKGTVCLFVGMACSPVGKSQKLLLADWVAYQRRVVPLYRQLVAPAYSYDVGLHTVAHQKVLHFGLQVRYPWICMGSYCHSVYASPLSMAASNCSLL